MTLPLLIGLGATGALLAACAPVPTTPTTTTTSTSTTSTSTTTTSTTTTSTTVPEPVDPTITGEACPPESGVTVVVDFTSLDNTVVVGCAEGPQASGNAALASAGFVRTDEPGPGTTCTIDGLPTEGYPYCWLTGGYWGYYSSPDRSTPWDFSMVGGDAGPLAEGSIQGWAWAPAFDGVAPRLAIADLADHTPLPECPVPDAPVLSIIASNEVLPFTIPGGGPIEIAVLPAGDDVSTAVYSDATTQSLAGLTGPTRVLARSASTDCQRVDIFDALYDVHAAYSPRAGTSWSPALAGTDPSLTGWATGFADYLPGADVTAGFQTPNNAVGAYGTDLVVLGNGGRITMTFASPITDGVGNDLAVFENGFAENATSQKLFAELAYVEVSSNGVDFVRFDSASQQPTAVAAFGFQSSELLGGLAGKDIGGFGTPFDLTALSNKAAVRNGTVDLSAITHVRIVDIVGANDYPAVGNTYPDSFGRQIFDAHKTTGSGGFDLRAVGALHQVAA